MSLFLNTLQSLLILAMIVAAAFLAARIITDAVEREAAREEEARRVSLAYLMAVPEPTAAPRAHLRLVHSGPGMPADVPYDQMKDLAL